MTVDDEIKFSFDHLDLTEKQWDQLDYYFQLLLDYNESVNLIAKTTDKKQLYIRHVYDVLISLEHFTSLNSLVDIGSGGGVPGVIIAIWMSDSITLIESKTKKFKFLSDLSKKLKLPHLKVKNSNALEINIKYDVITARGFGTIKKILDISKNMRHKKTKYLLYKGKRTIIDKELMEVQARVKSVKIILLNDPLNYLGERHLVSFYFK